MEITLHSPLDMHLHLREQEMLELVAPLSANHFSGAVIMPNLRKPIVSLKDVQGYREKIIHSSGSHSFTPYMTLFFQTYSYSELTAIKDEIIGIKLYPAGITTQSEAGVTDLTSIRKTLEVMEELDIPLLIHGETSGFVMDREREFLQEFDWIARDYPKLTVIMEHITTAEAVTMLDRHDNLFATVTLHHLMITLDDLAGGLLQPHLFCKPIAKTPKDLKTLQKAVFSAHPKIMFGSDSAPHPTHKKECCGCAAGIFSAPVALAALTELFEKADCLDKLQGFISDIAKKTYKITPQPKSVTLKKENWTVPEQYGNVRPFLAASTLQWRVSAIE